MDMRDLEPDMSDSFAGHQRPAPQKWRQRTGLAGQDIKHVHNCACGAVMLEMVTSAASGVSCVGARNHTLRSAKGSHRCDTRCLDEAGAGAHQYQ